MSLIIPAGFSQISIPFQHSGSPRQAVITFGVDSTDYAGDFVDMCNDIHDAWDASLGAEQDSEVTIGPVLARVGQDGGDPLAVAGTNTSTGGRAQATLPSNVALLVQKRSGIGGRRGRGRFYVPWIIADGEAGDTGLVGSISLAAFQTDADTFWGRLDAGTGMSHAAPMVILHDSSGAGAEPSPSVVLNLTVDPLVATQRRRLGR